MNEEILKNIEYIENGLSRLVNKDSVLYFLINDTKNATASVKYIYDIVVKTKELGYNSKILVQDNTYSGVEQWYGERYKNVEIISIKDDKPSINIDDFVFVPESYSNVLPSLANIKCSKIMLIQQKEYIFDSLPIGSHWLDYGFDRCITTTQDSKRYIDEYFNGVLTHVIPPFVEDVFKPSIEPQKPYIAISCRDRSKATKIISEFYLKYPHLRWITFRDMVQMSYDEFAENLSECMVSVWIDNESTFGTFPIESMKCNIPVIGKIPNNKPEWIGENGVWVTNEDEIVKMLSSYIFSWIDGQELYTEFSENMKNTVNVYSEDNFKNTIESIFNSIYNSRIETFTNTINKLKNNEQ